MEPAARREAPSNWPRHLFGAESTRQSFSAASAMPIWNRPAPIDQTAALRAYRRYPPLGEFSPWLAQTCASACLWVLQCSRRFRPWRRAFDAGLKRGTEHDQAAFRAGSDRQADGLAEKQKCRFLEANAAAWHGGPCEDT